MIHCAKCGAELIGSRKFCAACGTPAGDPRSPAASTGQAPISPPGRTPPAPGSAPGAPGSGPSNSGPAIQYAPAPTSRVNPFAQTAGPANTVRASDYGPPPASVPAELGSTTPGVGHPSSSPQVSPLAVSNVLSQRGAFENAITAGPEAAAAAAVGLFPPVVAQGPADGAQSSRRNAIPGTQLMPSMANPPAHGDAPGGATPSSGTASGAGSKRPDRTQLLGAIPAGLLPRPGGSAPASSGGAPSASGSGPQHAQPAPAAPPPQAQSLSQPPHMAPQPGWNPAAPYGGPQFAPQQPPAPPPPAPAQPGYGFGYVPGSRVTVTWSNGQRYPGTVQQVSGSQCLVVFPDGQHHWVEMQYVAPA